MGGLKKKSLNAYFNESTHFRFSIFFDDTVWIRMHFRKKKLVFLDEVVIFSSLFKQTMLI